MVAEGNIVKLYPQFMQLTDRKDNASPVTYPFIQNNLSASKIKPLDPRIYKDFIRTKDTFESVRNNVIQIKSQVNELDNKAHKNKDLTKAVFAALSPIIPFRRVSSMPDRIDDKDYAGIAGTVAVASILLPEDLRDTRDAARQIFKGIQPKYNYKEFQTPFSFIRGSFLEPIVNKITNKWGYYFHKWDKSLLKTKLGEKIANFLNVKVVGKEFTGRIVPQIRIDEETGSYIKSMRKVFAEKLEGSAIGKLICRGLQRTTVYGSLALSAICIPSIVKAFMKPQDAKEKFINAGKQTAKSAISVISTLSGIGLGGALLVSLGLGPAGSVIGMGIGCVIGAYVSNKINKNIKTI